MRAEIISVGTEILLGEITDTNASYLARSLPTLGIDLYWVSQVGDNQGRLVEILRRAWNRSDLTIITGGLGPTPDDLTRQALAEAAGVPLTPHAPSVATLEAFFEKLGRVMPEQNRVQALCPAGAEMLDNNCGTAPGIRMTLHAAALVVMPGVPHEMKAMFERHILPGLKDREGRVILTEAVHTFGLGESAVAERLGDLMARGRNPQVGTTVSRGVVSVRVRSEFPTVAEARRQMDGAVRRVERLLGKAVFGRGDETLAYAVGRRLRQRRQTVATAESCTGGLIAKMLTDVPGSSAWFRGGWVVYSNAMKQHALDVPADMLLKHGAVSEPVARQLAENARRKAEADYGLATTGIAGPDGGTPDKPVGTVWVALAGPDGRSTADRLRFPEVREVVRDRAANTALNMLRLTLSE
jgi:nicotinamide-nucleotide amidase